MFVANGRRGLVAGAGLLLMKQLFLHFDRNLGLHFVLGGRFDQVSVLNTVQEAGR